MASAQIRAVRVDVCDGTSGTSRSDTLFVDAMSKREEHMKIRNRFYASGEHLTALKEQAQVHDETTDKRLWTRSTLEDAIERARQMLMDDPQRNVVAISQIIRLVRRLDPPIRVEIVDE